MNIRAIIKDILTENQQTVLPKIHTRELSIDLSALPANKIITLTGFRRVGKTYLLFLTMQKSKPEAGIYFNFEDERLPESTEVLTELMYAIEELNFPVPLNLFLDEIHIIPQWGKFLRRISERRFRVIVTCSSSKMGLKEIPTELRGRTLHYSVFPLSFKEYLWFNGIDVMPVDSHTVAKVKRYFHEYLLVGGFPELCAVSELIRREIIHEYFRTLDERDLIERFRLKEEALLSATLKLLLNSLMISISKLTQSLKSMGFHCSKNTISNYLSFMEKSYFLHQGFYYSKTVKDQMQYPRKVYFIDNGFIKHLAFRPDEGRLLENLVAIELKRRGADLFYWKNAKGEEVDFVRLEGDSVQELIQVSYDLTLTDTRDREIRALKKGMTHFGVKNGIILTMEQEEEIVENGCTVQIIPVWKWLLGL
jgi:hypothetical protein